MDRLARGVAALGYVAHGTFAGVVKHRIGLDIQKNGIVAAAPNFLIRYSL